MPNLNKTIYINNHLRFDHLQQGINEAYQSLGITTHHDAVTGTSLSIVIEDYLKKLSKVLEFTMITLSQEHDFMFRDLIGHFEGENSRYDPFREKRFFNHSLKAVLNSTLNNSNQ